MLRFFLIYIELIASVLQAVHPNFTVESLFVLAVLSLYFAVVAGRRDFYPLVNYVHIRERVLKQCFMLRLRYQQRVCKLRAVVGLRFPNRKRKIFEHFFQK